MAGRRFFKPGVLCLGIGCSFFVSLLLSELSLVQSLEAALQDRLMAWRSPQRLPSADILLVKVKESDLVGPAGEQARYAALAEALLQNGAAGLVLNLLDNWTVEFLDETNPPLQMLVEQHSDRLVLVTPTAPPAPASLGEIETYYPLLPPLVGNDLRFAYDVSEIQGFFEVDNAQERQPKLDSPARLAHLSRSFYYNDPAEGQTVGRFKSALLLALEKFKPELAPAKNQRWPMQIVYYGPTGTFPSLTFEQICHPEVGGCDRALPPEIARRVRNKIVIIGFVAPENNPKVVLPVRSPFEAQMPGIEVQANILASLLSQSVAQRPPRWILQLAIATGAILISQLCTFKFTALLPKKRHFFSSLGAAIALLYLATGVAFTQQQLLLPLTLPVLTWLTTGIVVQLWLLYQMQQLLISQQRYEIAQLKSAETGAVLLQTRKLLQRIASGIHDGPLQELRLVMDKLELAPEADPDLVVEQLSAVGIDIRNYLQNIRQMADTLKVTPELRQGLVAGIGTYLQQLTASGTLSLTVVEQMQRLPEPAFNSQWIDAREDIFQFFREAMTNVIVHAQPPHGQATQVIVSLQLEGERCTLSIENDGSAIAPAHRRGGYGTKMMETVARSLPGGTWQPTVLKNGYRVELSWRHQFDYADLLDISAV
ncbi:MAG: CHASE2 domain-containing protein [Leptolyngbya sp. SIO4C1]|nr:CHASE2 domain-containing protein [Leptolyngbya sp. SIO4C1]